MKRIFAFIFAFFAIFTQAQTTDSTDNITEILQEFNFEDDPIAAALDSLLTLRYFRLPAEADTNAFVNDTAIENVELANMPDSLLAYRMEQLNRETPFDLTYNATVKRYIALYSHRRKEQMSRMLGLAEYYFPLFESTLDKYNLPLELKYLAIVESALNPRARSRVGAKGLWQFMYTTGRLNGLSVSSYVDERSDPYKSTEAACQFLSQLYRIFGDWNLALAAYNSGPGNVNKAIRRSGGKRDYWAIRAFLPRETAGYVPAFIAVNYTMAYAEELGIKPTPSIFSFYETDTVWVKETLTFDQIKKFVNIDNETLEALNPSYKYNIIPKVDKEPYFLVLPRAEMGVFINNEDTIYALAKKEIEEKEEELPTYAEMNEKVRHRVRSGETLGGIAEKYGVRVSDIKRWNGLRSDIIRQGQRLTVFPRKFPVASQSTKKSKPSVVKTGKNSITYTVRSGDTLYDIAKLYPGISADNIKEWNNISNSIRPGMKLVIHTQN